MERTHLIQLLGSFAVLAAPASPSHSAIFDRDDRQYVTPSVASPYSSVGEVKQHGLLMEHHTTGFLVDECHVLTTQSLLGYGQAPLGKRLTFKGAIGTPQKVSTRATVIAAGGLMRNRTGEQQYQRGGRDWLLLRLDKCLGASLGYVTLKTGPFSPYEFRDLQSAGYPSHRNRNLGLTVDPSCRFTAGAGISVWLNDCATERGDAGDPIFRISSSAGKPRMQVYAMQSAGYLNKAPIALVPGHDNQAVPMELIAEKIIPFLSATARQEANDGAVPPKRVNTILHNPQLVTADDRLPSHGGAR